MSFPYKIEILLSLKNDADHHELARLFAADDVVGFQKLTTARPPGPGDDERRWTALLGEAAKADAIAIAQFCLERGAKVGASVIAAVHRGQGKRVYSMLCSRSDIQIEQDFEKGDALRNAVYWENTELVEFCLSKGAHPDDSDNSAQWEMPPTLLGIAASESSLEVVKLLVEYGACKTDTGALQHAVDANRIEVVKYLLGQGFNPNELGPKDPFDDRCDVDMGTPLHKAIEGGPSHTELFEFLIDKTDLTIRDGRGRTPLELAEERGLTQFAERLRSPI